MATLVLGTAVLLSFSVALAPVASAHPLGNATVNHYDGLHLFADHVTVRAIEDVAEIPTLQRQPDIDRDADGTLSDPERSAYAAAQCRSLSETERVIVDDRELPLSVVSSNYSERPGAIQLSAGRLVCELQAPADLTRPVTLSVVDHWDSGGVGWHEITAVGSGVSLRDSVFPASSVSDELLRYPNDLLSSPLDVASGSVQVRPGDESTYRPGKSLAGSTAPVRALNSLTNRFNSLVGSEHLTIWVGLLAVLLSLLLGAGHAFLPGHGKTIMAAYLVGRRGRLRDVVTVGATVTVTHTAGVLVLGGLISVTTAFAPTAAEQYLAVLSGLMVVGVGVGLLVGAIRRRRASPAPVREAEAALTTVEEKDLVLLGAGVAVGGTTASDAVSPVHDRGRSHVHEQSHSHSHDSGRGHSSGHGHGHGHSHSHSHSHGHGHGHGHAHEPQRFGRSGLVGLGIAGGLVPSPSALLVLLAAIALDRTVFGVVLVLGYGLGMAGALTAAGLLLVRLRGRLGVLLARRRNRLEKLVSVLPVVTATLVLIVGAGLVLRALSGSI